MDKIKYIVNILIVLLLMAGVAIQRDGTLLRESVGDMMTSNTEQEPQVMIEETLPDGTRVINSTSLAKDVIGFGGRTPVKLFVKGDVIQSVEALPNAETPSFWDEMVASGLLKKWNGVTLSDAATMPVDAVSGATFSSVAVIGNVQRAAQHGASIEAQSSNPLSGLELKDFAGLLVILMGAVITLAKFRQKWLIALQLALNVAVLGFWCGSFLSLSTFTAWISNGVNLSLSIVTLSMFAVMIIMPLLGRKGSYCHIHCPMGSAQELVGMIPATKLKIKPNVVKFLNKLRYYILFALLFMMWVGVGFDLMNYEVFSAFIINSASTTVLVMAAVVILLSPFIPRPYCRFICPTGALITVSQKTKE